MIITVDKFGWNALLMKIIANIIVIILNMILMCVSYDGCSEKLTNFLII